MSNRCWPLRLRANCFAVWLCLFALLAGESIRRPLGLPVLQAAEIDTAQPGGEELASSDRPRDAQEKDRQKQVAIAGLMLLGVVALVLVILIAMAMWWAHRFRRQVGRPLPKQHPGDPLWYLRKGSADDSSASPESETDNENSNG